MNSDANRMNLLDRDWRILERMWQNHPSLNPSTSRNNIISSILNPTMLLSFSIDERARMMNVAKEEKNVENEVIRIIHSDNIECLKPNSGQGVNIAGHNICIGFTIDDEYDESIWEWHGHIVLYEDELEFRLEYFYGFYNEKLAKK